MRDLSDVDRQLGQLGSSPTNVTESLERVLGRDRSLERLDELLAGLVQEAGPAAAAVRAPTLIRSAREDALLPAAATAPVAVDEDTVVERAPAGVAAAAHADDEPELSVSEPPPELQESSWRAPAPSLEPVPEAPQRHSAATFAALFDLSERPPPQESSPTHARTPGEFPPHAQPGEPAPVDPIDRVAQRRSDIKALLEQDLDPSDFPRTSPPPRPVAAAAEQPEDDFELLVEDEEIVELEDEELEMLDD